MGRRSKFASIKPGRSEMSDRLPEYQRADNDTKVMWEGYSIPIREKKMCLAGAVYHPSNFYLNPVKSWNMLEDHQRDLNDYYENGVKRPDEKILLPGKDDKYLVPQPEFLVYGFFVAVHHKNEWHRGMILDQHERKPNEYQVSVLDYGDHKYFKLSGIRYIPVRFLQFPVQGIKCRLIFENKSMAEFQRRRLAWTDKEAEIFFQVVGNHECQVTFESIELYENVLANPVMWNVKIHKVIRDEAKPDSKKVSEVSLDQEFTQMLKEGWRKQTKVPVEDPGNDQSKRKTKLGKDDPAIPKNQSFPDDKGSNVVTWWSKDAYVTGLSIPDDAINVPLEEFDGLYSSDEESDEKEGDE